MLHFIDDPQAIDAVHEQLCGVLDLAKLESGAAEWHADAIDLCEVIEDAIAATSELFRERDVHVRTQLSRQVRLVTADRDRLMQVMLNLLSNAVKFCPPAGGRVTVTLSETAGALRVDVADNGIGITEENQQIIFEKFRQVGDTLTDKPQGTGLGLPICRQIIDHFGGRLWVDSMLGAGATFSFTLPLDAAALGRGRPAAVAAVG